MTTETNLIQATPDTLKGTLKVCALAKRPAFTWGSPGIGKSDIHRQVCDELNLDLIDTRVSQLDAVDTRGIPYVDAERTRWAIPEMFPDDSTPTMWFLDEMNLGTPSVQSAMYQLILDRRLGDYVLPDNVVVFAAGNHDTDRSNTHRMSAALANRFVHFELIVQHDAWERWAMRSDIHPAIIAFLRYRPELLHSWDARSTQKSQPTPRTWQFCSELLTMMQAASINGSIESTAVCGTVGEPAGAELLGFLRIYRNLPDPQTIIDAPEHAALHDDPAVNWALCGALAKRATPETIAAILTYAQRMGDESHIGPEFMTVLARGCAHNDDNVMATPAFIEWATANQDVLI